MVFCVRNLDETKKKEIVSSHRCRTVMFRGEERKKMRNKKRKLIESSINEFIVCPSKWIGMVNMPTSGIVWTGNAFFTKSISEHSKENGIEYLHFVKVHFGRIVEFHRSNLQIQCSLVKVLHSNDFHLLRNHRNHRETAGSNFIIIIFD